MVPPFEDGIARLLTAGSCKLTTFGDYQGDIVVLFLTAEAPNFINDCAHTSF
jgi:hypothetical protein